MIVPAPSKAAARPRGFVQRESGEAPVSLAILIGVSRNQTKIWCRKALTRQDLVARRGKHPSLAAQVVPMSWPLSMVVYSQFRPNTFNEKLQTSEELSIYPCWHYVFVEWPSPLEHSGGMGCVPKKPLFPELGSLLYSVFLRKYRLFVAL